MHIKFGTLILLALLVGCASVPVPVIVKIPPRTLPIQAMEPCSVLPLLPSRVADEPLDAAARDILLTVKQTQALYAACSAKQKAEAHWIKG